jgi:hypothetical protein
VHAPPHPSPTNKGADGVTPGQEEQVSPLLGVFPYVQRAAGTRPSRRPSLPGATALLHKAKEIASGSRSHDTL